ncbi:MAG: hypothetical protein LBN22_00175 [Clostridiales Family XIII bacterium]|jgi:hypothetical protein|nr:hypothetical protein [Clostridiales Family XIII bacterium]
MNKRKKSILFILIVAIITTFSLASCKDNGENVTVTSPDDVDFYVYFGDYVDSITVDTILSNYKEETGVQIGLKDPLRDNEKGIAEALGGDEPAVLYAASTTDVSEEYADNTGIPFGAEGYGLVADKMQLAKLAGISTDADEIDAYVDKLAKMTFPEFSAEASRLHYFIRDDENKVTVDKLNGVFSFPGAEKAMYGTELYEVLLKAMYPNKSADEIVDLLDASAEAISAAREADALAVEAAAEVAAADAEGSAEDSESSDAPPVDAPADVTEPTDLEKVSTAYINTLDFYTSMLAGKFAAGIRGTDISDEDFYGMDAVAETLMKGKAVWAFLDIDASDTLEQLDKRKSHDLVIIPLKIRDVEGEQDRLSVRPSYRMYVNGDADTGDLSKAQDFLRWYETHETDYLSALERSAASYLKSGKTLPELVENDTLYDYEKTIFGKKGVRLYLEKRIWDLDTISEMERYLVDAYIE